MAWRIILLHLSLPERELDQAVVGLEINFLDQ
jgi:hypothetical protein